MRSHSQSARVEGRIGGLIGVLILCAMGAVLACWALPLPVAVLAAGYWAAVVVVVRSDLASFTIPDEASLAIGSLGLVQSLLSAGTGVSHIHAVSSAALGGVFAFGLFWSVRSLYRRFRGRDGLGFGDVKLAGACAIWLHPTGQVAALELAACIAAVWALLRRGPAGAAALIPFGAFLAPAAWLTFLVTTWLRLP